MTENFVENPQIKHTIFHGENLFWRHGINRVEIQHKSLIDWIYFKLKSNALQIKTIRKILVCTIWTIKISLKFKTRVDFNSHYYWFWYIIPNRYNDFPLPIFSNNNKNREKTMNWFDERNYIVVVVFLVICLQNVFDMRSKRTKTKEEVNYFRLVIMWCSKTEQ